MKTNLGETIISADTKDSGQCEIALSEGNQIIGFIRQMQSTKKKNYLHRFIKQ